MGSEGLLRLRIYRRRAGFQTNPRGVGGTNWTEHRRVVTGFRPTLVGSEVTRQLPTPLCPQFQTNPRGVGGTEAKVSRITSEVSDQPSWGRRSPCEKIEGDILLVSDQPSWGRRHELLPTWKHWSQVSDQPSWGRRKTPRNWVSGLSPVSDQPSWGRRSEQSLRVS